MGSVCCSIEEHGCDQSVTWSCWSCDESRSVTTSLVKQMRIGVISDTHGLLRPEALAALRNSDRILHAGDVGNLEILDRLRELAPVPARRGNVDRGPWTDTLPTTEVIEVDGVSLYMIHDLAQLDLKPETAGFR